MVDQRRELEKMMINSPLPSQEKNERQWAEESINQTKICTETIEKSKDKMREMRHIRCTLEKQVPVRTTKPQNINL